MCVCVCVCVCIRIHVSFCILYTRIFYIVLDITYDVCISNFLQMCEKLFKRITVKKEKQNLLFLDQETKATSKRSYSKQFYDSSTFLVRFALNEESTAKYKFVIS